jgi:tungstate transport system ATP-binding protein
MTEIVYRITGLEKEYGGRRVLNIPFLEIHRGEVFCLVGPSGSGKSTLLRLLNFLEQPSAGTIEFGGGAFTLGREMPLELRRRVVSIFQHPVLLNRSVADNVAYGLRLRQGRGDASLVREALVEVGLEKMAQQRARSLSGGEAQRVALARALVLGPDVLLLDEPTANLDPHNVGLIETILRRQNQEHGVTLVLVTHNVFQARRLAKRIALLLEGRVIELVSTEAFFSRASDPRTKAFVQGDMVY